MLLNSRLKSVLLSERNYLKEQNSSRRLGLVFWVKTPLLVLVSFCYKFRHLHSLWFGFWSVQMYLLWIHPLIIPARHCFSWKWRAVGFSDPRGHFQPLCVVCSYTCGHFSIPGVPAGCYRNKLLQGEDYLLNMFTGELWKQQTFNTASKQTSGIAVSGTLNHQGVIVFYKMARKYYLAPKCFWKGYLVFAMQVAYLYLWVLCLLTVLSVVGLRPLSKYI